MNVVKNVSKCSKSIFSLNCLFIPFTVFLLCCWFLTALYILRMVNPLLAFRTISNLSIFSTLLIVFFHVEMFYLYVSKFIPSFIVWVFFFLLGTAFLSSKLFFIIFLHYFYSIIFHTWIFGYSGIYLSVNNNIGFQFGFFPSHSYMLNKASFPQLIRNVTSIWVSSGLPYLLDSSILCACHKMFKLL